MKDKVVGAVIIVLSCVFIFSLTVYAQTGEGLHSKGVFHYTDPSGGEVILDADDLQTLFQYAAEGKDAIVRALGGVGTNIDREATYEELIHGILNSQKVPAAYRENCMLATADNITAGNAAWADGSLVFGNSKDFLQNYIDGWRDGRNNTVSVRVPAEHGNCFSKEWEPILFVIREDASPSIKSVGCVQYKQGQDEVIFDAADLTLMKQKVDGYRVAAVDGLRQIGTRFLIENGQTVCQRNPLVQSEEAVGNGIDWEIVGKAIEQSQNVPLNIPVNQETVILGIEGAGEKTGNYMPAVADNISIGKGVWIDGTFIIGNGADNDRAYMAGANDGENQRLREPFIPVWSETDTQMQVNHVHTGAALDQEGVNGCYRNWKQTTSQSIICQETLTYLPAVWYPNPAEPDGGSWHGGFYSCGMHGGIYEGPGICGKVVTVNGYVWHHDLICCGEGSTYFMLQITGQANLHNGREYILTAQITDGEAAGDVIWNSDEKIMWQDANRNTIATGIQLTVTEPGIYYCIPDCQGGNMNIREASVEISIQDIISSDMM